MYSMSELAHKFLEPVLHHQAICIDATLGYGRDSRFFLEGNARRVFAYEIQEELYKDTTRMLQSLNPDYESRLHTFLKDHSLMDQDLDLYQGRIDAVIFNFGYDPHTLCGICTRPQTSVRAVSIGADLLKARGRMALVFYPHPAGKEEKKAVMEMLKARSDLELLEIRHPFKDNAPSLTCVEKKRSARSKKNSTGTINDNERKQSSDSCS